MDCDRATRFRAKSTTMVPALNKAAMDRVNRASTGTITAIIDSKKTSVSIGNFYCGHAGDLPAVRGNAAIASMSAKCSVAKTLSGLRPGIGCFVHTFTGGRRNATCKTIDRFRAARLVMIPAMD